MKNYFKKCFPEIFLFLKSTYHNTTYYQKKKLKLQTTLDEHKNKTELEIMEKVFSNNFIIHNGPFQGMKYIKQSSGSALLSKILGSYEEPIQDWIKEVIENNKYEKIIDIGCAEGYYSCGFAFRLPNAKILAYDIDDEARKNSEALKKLNKLDNIEIRAECTHEELNREAQNSTLVFCDIEGYERILLDPIKVPNLQYVDMLIESHDCYFPNITDELIHRFYMTHTMRIVVDYPYRVNEYTTPKKCTKEEMNYIVNEGRSKYMKFIYMKSIDKTSH